MDIEEFEELIEKYRDAVYRGGFKARTDAKIVLKDAWRALEAERDAYKAEANLLEHKVITCGVAASHSDANLAHTGAYAGKWNSAQAVQVRALRAERDALRADAERYRFLEEQCRIGSYRGVISRKAIDAAIAAKEPQS